MEQLQVPPKEARYQDHESTGGTDRRREPGFQSHQHHDRSDQPRQKGRNIGQRFQNATIQYSHIVIHPVEQLAAVIPGHRRIRTAQQRTQKLLLPVPVQLRTKLLMEMPVQKLAQKQAHDDAALDQAGIPKSGQISANGAVDDPPCSQSEHDTQKGLAHVGRRHQDKGRKASAKAARHP